MNWKALRQQLEQTLGVDLSTPLAQRTQAAPEPAEAAGTPPLALPPLRPPVATQPGDSRAGLIPGQTVPEETELVIRTVAGFRPHPLSAAKWEPPSGSMRPG